MEPSPGSDPGYAPRTSAKKENHVSFITVDFAAQTVIMLRLLFSAGSPFASKQDLNVPNSFSAKKRVRQNVKSRALNRWRKSQIKDRSKNPVFERRWEGSNLQPSVS